MATTREARLDFRLQPEDKDRIEQAAKVSNESISSFVVHAATAEADRVLARADITMMPAEEFDALLASLDVAEDVPALALLGKSERRFIRK
jgi:uncharacterized protein (DUF1778 family)